MPFGPIIGPLSYSKIYVRNLLFVKLDHFFTVKKLKIGDMLLVNSWLITVFCFNLYNTSVIKVIAVPKPRTHKIEGKAESNLFARYFD